MSVVFVSLLLQGCDVTCHLVAVAVPGTDRFTAPLVAYPLEDVDALRRIPNLHVYSREPALTTAASIAQFGEEMRRFTQGNHFDRKRGVLLIYLNAHGVSDGGQSFLLCSDFMRPGQEGHHDEGRYPLPELLQNLDQQQSPTALTLLILDAGHLEDDPRIGMAVNEFPRLVEQQVKSLRDQPLWVLLSHSVFQTSHVDRCRRKSVFGASVAEALEGKADGQLNGQAADGYVSLPELYQYVHHRCTQWCRAIGAPPQTPLLMRAGSGLVELADLEKPEMTGKQYRLLYLKVPVGAQEADQAPAAKDAPPDNAGNAPNVSTASAEKSAGPDSGGQQPPAKPPQATQTATPPPSNRSSTAGPDSGGRESPSQVSTNIPDPQVAQQ